MKKMTPVLLSIIAILSISSCNRTDIFKLSQEVLPTVAPAAPGSLAASTLSAYEITLTWFDNSDNESSFVIERSIDGTTFSEIASSGADTTSYTNSGLTGASTYHYRIKASNTAGDSTYSGTVSIQTFCELLAHWKLDGDFQDETTNNNDAASTGSFSYTTGRVDTCPVFDWTNAGTVSSPVGIDKDVYTITAWVKRYVHNTAPYIRLSGVGHIVTDASGLWKLTSEGEIGNVDSGVILPKYEWHHLTIVLDRRAGEEKAIFYYDGAHQATQGITPWTATITELQIGTYNTSYRWNGCIDDVRIYNGELTASQILDLYNSYPAEAAAPAPAAPTAFTAESVSYNSIRLSWSDNATSEYGYRIEETTDGGATYSDIGTTVPNIEFYTVTGLTANTSYTYRVVAYNDSDSIPSTAISTATKSPGELPELISYWKMDGNLDDVMSNNDGTPVNTFSYETGMVMQCAKFDLTNYGIVSTPYGLDRDVYTVMAWVQRTGHNTAPYIRLTGIGHFITYTNTLDPTSSEWVFKGENGASETVSTGFSLTLGEWYHLTIVINRSSGILKFYADDGTTVQTFTKTTTPWMAEGTQILIGSFAAGYMWDGLIDNLMIYGGELTESEIDALK